MDYEKAYKEALDKFKKFKEKYFTFGRMGFGDVICDKTGTAQDELDAIFPELKESEDERIRKAIIHYILYETKGTISEATEHTWVKWLEKQKAKEEYDRMLPIYNDRDSFESALEKAWKSYGDSGARTVDSCEDDYVECAHAKGFREGFLYGLEKWKEQKENPKNADSIPADCTSDAKYEDRSSKYGVFPEDVLVVARACEKLEAHGYKELAHALKNVNLYTEEQKSTGWSEEDEKMLNDILGILHSTEDAALANFSEQKKWLKSLRSRPKSSDNWKPTEEQMEALEDVIEALNFKINLGSLHLYKRGAIGELYQQLRKL